MSAAVGALQNPARGTVLGLPSLRRIPLRFAKAAIDESTDE